MMRIKTTMLFSTLGALALTASGPVLAQTAPERPISGTRLDVSAQGEVHRAPDLVTIGAGVVTQASTAGAAMTENAKRMAGTIAALRKAGIAERDIQTSALSLAPQYRYGENQPPVITGYQASNQVNVRFHDIARAGAVLDALVSAGANQIAGPSFEVEHPDAALDEARVQAVAKARARAELYAKAAGLSVKRILSISETGGGYQPPRPMMAAMSVRKAAFDTQVAPGEQSLSVNVSVSFELG